MKRGSRLSIVLFGLAALMLGAAAIAWACTPNNIEVSNDPQGGSPITGAPAGSQFYVMGQTGAGFAEGVEVVIALTDAAFNPVVWGPIGVAPAERVTGGGFEATLVTIPADAPVGDWYIVPYQESGNRIGKPFTVTQADPGTPPPPPPGGGSGGPGGGNGGGNNSSNKAPETGRADVPDVVPSPDDDTAIAGVGTSQQDGTTGVGSSDRRRQQRREEPSALPLTAKTRMEPAVARPATADADLEPASVIPSLTDPTIAPSGRNVYLVAGVAIFGVGLVLLLGGFMVAEMRRGRAVARHEHDDAPA